MGMPRGSELIGLPVLVGPKLRALGRVQEVLFGGEGLAICGLVLDGGGWLMPKRVLDFRAVKAIGETSLLADERYLPDASQGRCCRDLHGLPVLSEAGAEVGLMDDFYFDRQTGQVTALQLSRGFVDDLLQGKAFVALTGPVVAGEAAILLADGDPSGGAYA